MPSALSVALREHIIEVGFSRRHAAERFGVGKASAIRGNARFRDEGEVASRPAGGDRPPPAIETHAKAILELLPQESADLPPSVA